MTAMTASATPSAPGSPPVPRLQNGDRLTRAQFERRYERMPSVQKAQLIEGVVYMPSPVRALQHSQPNDALTTWIGVYVARHPGLISAGNATVRLDEDNEPQPDVVLMKRDGSARVDDDGYITGPPELVGEVAASTVSIDLHAKLNAYRRNGVREYLVWRVEEDAIDWFVLRDGRYEPLPADAQGVVSSTVFAGLRLDVPAMLRGDLAAVLKQVGGG